MSAVRSIYSPSACSARRLGNCRPRFWTLNRYRKKRTAERAGETQSAQERIYIENPLRSLRENVRKAPLRSPRYAFYTQALMEE